jgi:PAS domain S-box-containing protein
MAHLPAAYPFRRSNASSEQQRKSKIVLLAARRAHVHAAARLILAKYVVSLVGTGSASGGRWCARERTTMPSEQGERSETAQQVNDLFDAVELTKAVDTAEFRQFLDHIPIAIVVSKFFRGDQRICYANRAFETLTGRAISDCTGRGWSIFAEFRDETDSKVTLHQAMLKGGEFLGTFQTEQPKLLVVEAYSGLIQNEDGTENYRIAALIDVTDRARAEREEYIRQIRDKDVLLKELQHRVKNNLQLVVALVRLEARSERREGGKANLAMLAGRIESLQLLYQVLSTDAASGEIDLGHYVSQIATAVMNTYAVDGIRLNLKVDYAPVSINIALSVGLVVNELLTNAFKHAFGGRGHGVITMECLRKGQDRYRVVVADDGVGLPSDVVWPVPGKIGALIVQTLRENTRTDLNVETAPDKGVRVTITFDHKASVRKVS